MPPRPETLKKIEQDIADGNLGKARDRLHGLVGRFRDDFSLRKQLGDVYHRLQYPERAGCFWYLEKHKTEEMQRACDAYVESMGGDPFHILAGLKFRQDPETLPAGYPREALLSLKSQAPGYRFSIRQEQRNPRGPKSFGDQVRDVLALAGCAMLAVGISMIFVFGIITLIMFGRGYGFEKP